MKERITAAELKAMTMKELAAWVEFNACAINRTMVMSWGHEELFKGYHIRPEYIGYKAGRLIVKAFHFTSRTRKADAQSFAEWLHWAIFGEYPAEETTETAEQTEETETETAAPSATSANEETAAEEQTTDTEEEEEEQTMKPEVIFSRIREEVEARTERSAWSRGVTAYALDLVDELEEATEGGYFDLSDLEAPKLVDRALLNGATDWNQYSWGGCSLCYDGQIAERLCTPSELKKTRHGERRPNSREEWLDTQARALSQAAARVKGAIKSATLKTYTCPDNNTWGHE